MPERIATRDAFGEALYEAMKENPKLIALTADLGESLRMLKIREEMPERFVDTGVAEANMAGVAAGLAIAGFIPVAGTFSVFMARAYDHIRLQICQNNLHAVLVGSHGGISNAMDGGSAHALEDLAYLRSLPNMTILNPGDFEETKKAFRAAIEAEGPVFLRLYREPTPPYSTPDSAFELGKANVLREGKQVTIVGTGPQIAFAMQAAEALAKEGVEAEVIGVHTLKPLDGETISVSARKTGKVVTVEDHNINGGLGSAVAEALGERQPTRMKRVAVNKFGESGKYEELIAKVGIDAEGIVRAVKDIIK